MGNVSRMTKKNAIISSETKVAAKASVVTLPKTVLDTLASRFRGSGAFVAVLDRSGALAYHDAAASPFFTRLALPLLQSPGTAQPEFAAALSASNASSATLSWRF